MKIKEVHNFNIYEESEFINIQNELKKKISLKNIFSRSNIRLVAGVDLAYWENNNKQYGTCCIVVIDYNTKEVVEKVNSVGEIKVPYIPGFLAFREMPLVIEASKKLVVEPDIFIFDGNGYLHQRHMGIATHASFFLNKPTIGVAKSYLKIKETDFEMPEDEEGSYTDIVINKEIYGRVLRTRKTVKPIFISCGNYIDLDSSTEIVLNLINNESRLPIPTRLADLETHIKRRELR
ncbi:MULTISPECIES: endonuclease V [Clostridium]|uniref:Endonuclease V n=2 Tax=Clostridium sporogenes TaxID=1509 RepID=A0A7X5PAR5_CLOSG|nr:endonuclease V [Clostridium sporogenes]AJD29737.1 endonuclease V [Clostridium botulinum Prevot_594]HDK7156475.1 endonuclease V [Clostridium botulinum]KRU44029.1 endonuclease V [Clostridium sporogenes]MBY7064549.1 endonuclease V [Clostridium sporogenes]MBY7069820.1 endonuclease V [Clostridium sporogenes]